MIIFVTMLLPLVRVVHVFRKPSPGKKPYYVWSTTYFRKWEKQFLDHTFIIRFAPFLYQAALGDHIGLLSASSSSFELVESGGIGWFASSCTCPLTPFQSFASVFVSGSSANDDDISRTLCQC